MPYKCSSCGLEYESEDEAKDCCGADASMLEDENIDEEELMKDDDLEEEEEEE